MASKKHLRYVQYNSLTAARTLATINGQAVPSTADYAEVSVETQPVRWRADGTDPTAAIGNLLPVNTTLQIPKSMFGTIKFIETAATAVMSLNFFKTG